MSSLAAVENKKSFLTQVTTGKVQKPYFMVLYGPSGIGKTTFAAQAEKTLITGPEEGSNNIDVARAPKAESFEDQMNIIRELRNEKHKFKTLAVDSLGALEPLVWEAVCKMDGSKTIEQAQGGYGKGFVMANKLWQQMINELFALRDEKGMNIICIAHSLVKSFNDPLLPQPYDRYLLNMNEKAAALWTREVDFLGFTNYEIFLKIGQTEKRNKAFTEGKRILYTQRQPGFEAKNRLGLPEEIELDFEVFEREMKSAKGEKIESIRSEIATLTAQISDEATKTAVSETVTKAGEDRTKLYNILNRLKVITKQ